MAKKPRRVKEAGPFFHGTDAVLKPGDLLEPRGGSGGPEKAVFTSSDWGMASEFGRKKANGKGANHIYEVAPEDDDVWDNPGRGLPGSFTHQKPLKVVRHWMSSGPQGNVTMGDSRQLNIYAARERMRRDTPKDN